MNIESIEIHDPRSLELLKAAGFLTVEAVANASVESLTSELRAANAILRICDIELTENDAAAWIGMARDMVGELEVDATEVKQPVNYEAVPGVSAMLADAPYALPLPSKVLMDNHLAVSQIPPGILLNCYAGDLDVRVETIMPKSSKGPRSTVTDFIKLGRQAKEVQRPEVDKEKYRSLEEAEVVRLTLPRTAVEGGSGSSGVGAFKPALKDEVSYDRYLHGEVHGHPVRLFAGAFTTLLVILSIPLALLAVGLLVLSVKTPDRFSWVPEWLLVFPAAVPLFGLIYVCLAFGVRCRACGYRIFAHRTHARHSSAHHVWGLGYIVPLALHLMFRGWFRCSHCGTNIILKKDK